MNRFLKLLIWKFLKVRDCLLVYESGPKDSWLICVTRNAEKLRVDRVYSLCSSGARLDAMSVSVFNTLHIFISIVESRSTRWCLFAITTMRINIAIFTTTVLRIFNKRIRARAVMRNTTTSAKCAILIENPVRILWICCAVSRAVSKSMKCAV